MKTDDRKALASEIATQYGGRLRRYLSSRLGRSSADVSDLEQEVFLSILRVGPDTIRNPAAYVMTVAGHVLHQHIVRGAEMQESLEGLGALLEQQTASRPSPEGQVDAQRRLESMDRTLEKCAPNVHATFVLHLRDGMTLEEIATELGVSRQMVKKYLAKALDQCDEHMKPEG